MVGELSSEFTREPLNVPKQMCIIRLASQDNHLDDSIGMEWNLERRSQVGDCNCCPGNCS
jgi:hypothetical protein